MGSAAKAKGTPLRCGFGTMCKLNLLEDPDVQNALIPRGMLVFGVG